MSDSETSTPIYETMPDGTVRRVGCPGDRNTLMYPKTKEEIEAKMSWADIFSGKTPATFVAPPPKDVDERSRGLGLFVAIRHMPSGRKKVSAITADMIAKQMARAGARTCVHHIGGASRCSLTPDRIKSCQANCKGPKCSLYKKNWFKIAKQTGAYIG